jgi:hypothetical protein
MNVLNQFTWRSMQMYICDDGLMFTSYWMDHYYVKLSKGQRTLGL